ncbi:MAG: SpoIIE family protein phosphatase [Bacteroidales bacterium]|nr:SpoIIE family protein phosphatase [Bacteroidales bacterium]MBQ9312708.1 SpoIIE family protein phosphatase [Bacteroidales bacterium]
MINNIFVEAGSFQVHKNGNFACGDTILLHKIDNQERCIAVLSDGLGSGIKANVLSTMTASMAMNFSIKREPIMRTARTIMDTLPIDSKRNISYATFTIIDIDQNGNTMIAEFDTPPLLLVRDGKVTHLNPETFKINTTNETDNYERILKLSDIALKKGDRLIVYSDGVSQSGMGKDNMPFGWEDGVETFIENLVKQDKNISARGLSRRIVRRAEMNDDFKTKDDISCICLYVREPRKLLICTGPPFNEEKDKYLADVISSYNGKKIVCGGTTSQIIARELGKDLEVEMDLDKFASGLPPESKMDGVDLVTEGIITLGALSRLLEEDRFNELPQEDSAWNILKYIMDADIIDFLVGTKINVAHQDPSLPIELEIRRNVIKRIKGLIENKLLKTVNLEFI